MSRDLESWEERTKMAFRIQRQLRQLALAILFGVASLLLISCARPIDTAVAVVNAMQPAITDAHDTLKTNEVEELQRAVDAAPTKEAAEKDTAVILAKYKPWWDRYGDLALAWIATRATVEQAQSLDLANMSPDTMSLLAAVAKLGQAWGAFAAAVGQQIVKP